MQLCPNLQSELQAEQARLNKAKLGLLEQCPLCQQPVGRHPHIREAPSPATAVPTGLRVCWTVTCSNNSVGLKKSLCDEATAIHCLGTITRVDSNTLEMDLFFFEHSRKFLFQSIVEQQIKCRAPDAAFKLVEVSCEVTTFDSIPVQAFPSYSDDLTGTFPRNHKRHADSMEPSESSSFKRAKLCGADLGAEGIYAPYLGPLDSTVLPLRINYQGCHLVPSTKSLFPYFAFNLHVPCKFLNLHDADCGCSYELRTTKDSPRNGVLCDAGLHVNFDKGFHTAEGSLPCFYFDFKLTQDNRHVTVEPTFHPRMPDELVRAISEQLGDGLTLRHSSALHAFERCFFLEYRKAWTLARWYNTSVPTTLHDFMFSIVDSSTYEEAW